MLIRTWAFVAVWLLVQFSVVGETNAPVRTLGLTKSYGIAAQLFDEVVNLADLQKGLGYFLQTTVDNCRHRAEKMGKSAQSIGSLGGTWLEYAVLVALKEYKLTPVYWQAEFAKVPDNFNDVTLWSQEFGPIILSCKTSLRERYKQADLESLALQKHYPKAKFYLITLDDDLQHLARTRKKIAAGELLALQAIYAPDNADELLKFLKTLTLVAAPEGVLHKAKTVR